MQRTKVVTCHASNETLERYAIETLPEGSFTEVEEHLLICEECRQQLIDTEEYLAAMRSAAREWRRGERPRATWLHFLSWTSQPVWAAVFAALILAVLAGYQWHRGQTLSLPPLAIALEATRGTEAAQAPAGRPLMLMLDLTELPTLPAYRLEVVNAQGSRVLDLGAQPRSGKLRASLSGNLTDGVYFVRLYSQQAELLREYALEIKTPSVSDARH